MKELLNAVKKQYFLRLGNNNFSPLMEISAGISLEYCKNINEGKCSNYPFFLCFPEKGSASLWTAISILTNYYFEDYIDYEVDGISFKRGQKVKIFNCIGEVQRVSGDKVILKFKDQGGIPITKRLRGQMSPAPETRALSLKKRFASNYKRNKTNRNPISKILVPKDSININQNNLESKVLLIAGRGNVKSLKKILNEVEIYDTSLSQIYPENKNLIIKSNLKPYKEYFDQNRNNEFLVFRESIIKLHQIIDIKDAKHDLEKIINKLQEATQITLELDEQIETFFQNYEDELQGKIKFLRNKYPGIVESLPKKLRAVVINDIDQLSDYPNTIAGFLENKIPVIFISNRNIINNFDLGLYQQLFKSNPNYYRLNWNKEKVKALICLTNETNFIDQGLWNRCKRYAKQSIHIKVFDGPELDVLAPLLLSHIKDIDDFELFQKAFYNYFYPALYSLKNSSGTTETVKDLVEKFNEVFNSIKNIISKDIANDFERAISLSQNFVNNTKPIEKDDSVFSQLISSKSDELLFIPSETNKINTPNEHTEKIKFNGFPYSEYRGKHLLNSTIVYFVPQIKILCWPNEASLTYNYLNRRIKAGYFTDNVEEIIQFNSDFLLKNEDDFQHEIDKYLKKDKFKNAKDQEEPLEFIHTFKYKGYGAERNENNTFIVKCDILNFTDDSFMFLPHNSKILAQAEDDNGNLKISKRNRNELKTGDIIFKYIKDRQVMRDIAKSKENMSGHFDKLESWKNILESLYANCNYNLDDLKLLLDKTKAENKLDKSNPSISSLRNWLFDDEFLKPENDNLKVILLANNEIDIDKKLEQLDISYQNVVSFTISLSSQIKKHIAKQLSSKPLGNIDLNVNIEGNQILIQARNIISVESNNIEVDYHNTRKILC